jgi:hypothetical protein
MTYGLCKTKTYDLLYSMLSVPIGACTFTVQVNRIKDGGTRT